MDNNNTELNKSNMENQTIPTENNPSNGNNKNNKNILIAIVAVVVILVGAYFLFEQKSKENKNQQSNKPDSTAVKKDSVKTLDSLRITDSLKANINNINEEEYEDDRYGTVVYVGSGQVIGGKQVKYGDILYVDFEKSDDNRKLVYLTNPYKNKALPPATAIHSSNVVYEGTFENYKKYFSLAPFRSLPATVKDLILENNYNNGNYYYVTQNADRAKTTICFGDFDGDNLKDYAILLDNNEKQISRLIVICTNSETRKPYISFAENYNDKMRINSFKKGAMIIVDSELQAAEMDGIILKGEDVKLAVVYEKKLQKFKTYYQE